MNLKKILAVILCLAAIAGVMAVAYVTAAAQPVAASDPPAPTQPVDNRTVWEKLADWWDSFYPSFVKLWDGGFKTVSDFLVLAFRVLLKLIGLGTWIGPQ